MSLIQKLKQYFSNLKSYILERLFWSKKQEKKKRQWRARKKVVTHVHVDSDAVVGACVELIRNRLGSRDVKFMPASTKQLELKNTEIPVDIEARKHGDSDSFVGAYCSDVLPMNVVEEINEIDSTGKSESRVPISMLISALRLAGKDDRGIIKTFLPIVRGLMRMRSGEEKARELTTRAKKVQLGEYWFLLTDGEETISPYVKKLAREKGICGTIYRSSVGWGIAKFPGVKYPDLSKLRLEGWFTHPGGFLVCYGSRKAPKHDDPPQFESLEVFIEWANAMLTE